MIVFRYESVIATLCENLDSLDEPEARAAMIWIVGEYAERIDNADELLESFLEGFHDESTQVCLGRCRIGCSSREVKCLYKACVARTLVVGVKCHTLLASVGKRRHWLAECPALKIVLAHRVQKHKGHYKLVLFN